jgi:RimJ/RimL family protein N-acetyltransferase
MPKITIRYPLVKDAKRLLEIFNNPNFIYINISAKSVADEIRWIKARPQKRKDNHEWNYAIIYGDKIIGSIGIKINQEQKFIGEIGYYVDEKYWGKGIAAQAVKLAEQEGFKKLGLSRIEIIMCLENKASEKVAIKNNYKKEGRMKKAIIDKHGVKWDAWLYAKVL